eukprot:8587018-Alexandrium_andersonii.AAC.1
MQPWLRRARPRLLRCRPRQQLPEVGAQRCVRLRLAQQGAPQHLRPGCAEVRQSPQGVALGLPVRARPRRPQA